MVHTGPTLLSTAIATNSPSSFPRPLALAVRLHYCPPRVLSHSAWQSRCPLPLLPHALLFEGRSYVLVFFAEIRPGHRRLK